MLKRSTQLDSREPPALPDIEHALFVFRDLVTGNNGAE